MALKKNILANYISQIYVTLVGIAIVPFYIQYMGVEAYGLVGFFAMLQVLFNLLDMGLTPTMARETARYKGGLSDAFEYRRLFRAFESIFLVVALLGGSALFLFSDVIANKWLKANSLPTIEITLSLNIIAIIVAMRSMGGLYRGAISGSERYVWLSTFNSTIATLRFVGVLPVLIYLSALPSTFFFYQLSIATIELLGLTLKAYQLFPTLPPGKNTKWSWASLKPILKFSLTIAFTSSVWVLVTQTDKMVLSHILSLSDYGYFTLAVLVASGIMIVSGPVSSVLMSRMANLDAQGNNDELIRLYRQATQFIGAVTCATATTVALGSKALLLAWTGNATLAEHAAPILSLYAWGNGVLAVSAFPYYLQYAKGDLNLHLVGNAIFVVILVPTIIIIASNYGGLGAGYVWLGMNVLSFFAWLPLIHKKFAPSICIKWYTQDIFPIWIVTISLGILISQYTPSLVNRFDGFLHLSIMGFGTLFAALVSVKEIRAWLLIKLKIMNSQLE